MAIYVPLLSHDKRRKKNWNFEEIMDECRWHIRAKLNELFTSKWKNSFAFVGRKLFSLSIFVMSQKVSWMESSYPGSKNRKGIWKLNANEFIGFMKNILIFLKIKFSTVSGTLFLRISRKEFHLIFLSVSHLQWGRNIKQN